MHEHACVINTFHQIYINDANSYRSAFVVPDVLPLRVVLLWNPQVILDESWLVAWLLVVFMARGVLFGRRMMLLMLVFIP